MNTAELAQDPASAHLFMWLGIAATCLFIPVVSLILWLNAKRQDERHETLQKAITALESVLKSDHATWRRENDTIRAQLTELMVGWSRQLEPVKRDLAVLTERISRKFEDTSPGWKLPPKRKP